MDDIWQGIVIGLGTALSPNNLAYVVVGCLVGTFVGLLPGLGPAAAIALMIPIAYGLDPASGLILMAGVYYGATFGGSTSSILVNAPGESSSVATAFDGYPLARQGHAGKALAIAAYGSFIGGTVGALLLLLAARPLAEFASIGFHSADYFLLMLFGLATVSVFAGSGQIVKAWAAAIVGMMLATVGTDKTAGVHRFTFGESDLVDGISFVLLAMAVFAMAEALMMSAEPLKAQVSAPITRNSLRLQRREVVDLIPTVTRSSLLGFFVGALPGAGATVASFLAYGTERSLASAAKKSEFGRGSLRGLAAPETAANAASTGAFVPLLTLGIPGSATTAVLLSVMISYGVQPGPELLATTPELFWGVIISMYIGNLVLLVINLPLIPYVARLVMIPRAVLIPLILFFAMLGVYLVSFNPFDLKLMAAFAAVAFVLRWLRVPPAPMLLGFVLGSLLEERLRNALLRSSGSLDFLWERPLTMALTIAVSLVLIYSIHAHINRSRLERLQGSAPSP